MMRGPAVAGGVRRGIGALLAALALAATGCGALTSAPGPSTGQASLPPPVLTQTADAAAPTAVRVAGRVARVRTVDTDADGVLLPPKDIGELGWWIGSARPGAGAGTVVITGHVDDVERGTGFAAAFTGLRAGDEVFVTTADRSEHRYAVTDNRAVAKEGGLPVDELNRLDGPETLALVTCGGPFVGPPLGYLDNIVVFARPR